MLTLLPQNGSSLSGMWLEPGTEDITGYLSKVCSWVNNNLPMLISWFWQCPMGIC